MIGQVMLLVVGFVVLIKGADVFVDGASSVARNFKISKMLIGLTIVSFGTSAPEFAVSVKSLLSGNGDIVLGNVIGSNILNILLILGIASLVHSLHVKNATVKRELPITLLITAIFAALLSDHLFDPKLNNMFTRGDGIVLLLSFSIFVYYLIAMMRNKTAEITEEDNKSYLPLFKAVLYTIVGILAIIIGSNLVVDSASNLATILGVSQKIIGLTIVALGTSLPELVTSVVATKKGEYDIAIGNVVGSNIFNIGVVIGLPVALLGGISHVTFDIIDLFVMLSATILLFIFSFNDRKITKREGIILLLIFVIYYTHIIMGSIK